MSVSFKKIMGKVKLGVLAVACALAAVVASSCMLRDDFATVAVLLPGQAQGEGRVISEGEKSGASYRFWFNGIEKEIGQIKVAVGSAVEIKVAAYDGTTGEQFAAGAGRIEKTVPGTNEVRIELTESRPPLQIAMVAVPGGNVTVNNSPQSVGAFRIGKYEITQGEWKKVMRNTAGYAKELEAQYGIGDNYPMYYVAWYDAIAFCNKLSIRNGRSPYYSLNGETNPDKWPALNIQGDLDGTWDGVKENSGANGYRLPTEAEWVFAATANGNFTYSGGNTIAEVAWYQGNSNGTAHPVGQKTANAFGLHDMSGNVFEWCWDTVSSNKRVAHGGNFTDAEGSCGITNQGSNLPGFRGFNFGFRVVCAN